MDGEEALVVRLLVDGRLDIAAGDAVEDFLRHVETADRNLELGLFQRGQSLDHGLLAKSDDRLNVAVANEVLNHLGANLGQVSAGAHDLGGCADLVQRFLHAFVTQSSVGRVGKLDRREDQIPFLQMGGLHHALADEIAGVDEVLADKGETAARGRALRVVDVECDHRDAGVNRVADGLLESMIVPDHGGDAVNLVGDVGLDDVVLENLVVIGVLDVEVDVGLFRGVLGALDQRIEKRHARRRVNDHADLRLSRARRRRSAGECGNGGEHRDPGSHLILPSNRARSVFAGGFPAAWTRGARARIPP